MYGRSDSEPKTCRLANSKSKGRNKTFEQPFTVYNDQSPGINNKKCSLNQNKSEATIKPIKSYKEVSLFLYPLFSIAKPLV